MSEGVKKREFPNVFVILFVLSLAAAALTWLVPAGEFNRVKVGNITEVVPGSFHLVSPKPQGLWDVFMAIVAGFKAQASLIYMVFFVGAAVSMLQMTKAIDMSFAMVARAVRGREAIAIFTIMGVMSLGGATGVFGNVTLVLIPIGIVLSLAMRFDRALGFAMIFFGSFSGFNVGWANFGTIGIAQSIAQVPIFSGIEVRILFHLINFLLSYGFVMLYFYRIRKDPTRSLNYEPGMALGDYMGDPELTDDASTPRLTTRQSLSLVVATLGIGVVVLGALQWKWGADHISATFLAVSLLIGLISGMGLNGTARSFIKGCTSCVEAAFIIGFANAITVLLSRGLILDTIVYHMAEPINQYGTVMGANLMLLANIGVNCFISSGSGQATAVMPIMIPIADLTGITRQVAVQAFQFGDGFTNCLHPTVGSLMGGLVFARVAYLRYLKWATPLVLVQLLLSFVAITVLQNLKWTGV